MGRLKKVTVLQVYKPIKLPWYFLCLILNKVLEIFNCHAICLLSWHVQLFIAPLGHSVELNILQVLLFINLKNILRLSYMFLNMHCLVSIVNINGLVLLCR